MVCHIAILLQILSKKMIKVKAILTLEKGYKFFISLFKTSFTWQTYCVHGSFKKHNETPLEFTKNKGFRP